jgi:Putative bacterial sensory transduction regulator
VSSARTEIESYLSDREIRFERVSPDDWAIQLKGEKKLSITVLFALRERTLQVESFFIRRPSENHADLYAFLLRTNMRIYGVRFAIDDIGDVYLVGRFPVDAVTADELDRVLGAILSHSDDLFMPAIEIGFASYLQRDMAWRAAQGAPAGPPRSTVSPG